MIVFKALFLAIVLAAASCNSLHAQDAAPCNPQIQACGVSTAQAVADVPLKPAPLPDSGKGWADFLTKKLPDFLVVATPIILMILRAGGAVAILERIPTKLVPLTSGVLAALMAALGATGADVALGAGGIDPLVAAVEAGPLATAAHYGIRAVLKKKAEQKDIDEAVGHAL